MVLSLEMLETHHIFAIAHDQVRSDKSARRMVRYLARSILCRAEIYLQSEGNERKLRGFSSGNSRVSALFDDLSYPGAKPSDVTYQQTYRDKNRDAINAKRAARRAARREAGIAPTVRTVAQKAAQNSYAYDPITGATSEARRKANKRYYDKHRAAILAKHKADHAATVEAEQTGRKRKKRQHAPVYGPLLQKQAEINALIDAERAEYKRKTRATTQKDIIRALKEERDRRLNAIANSQ